MNYGNKVYYKFPLNIKGLLEGENIEKCSEIESIDKHIDLLITTCQGEHFFDKKYGAKIWEMDFENIDTLSKWQDQFIVYLSEAIKTYEPRITDCKCELSFSEVKEENILSKNVNIHKCVEICIKAVLLSNQEPCTLHYQLYLSPLSKK